MNALKKFAHLICAMVIPASSAFAQEAVDRFPSKPITLIVATALGGAGDVEARLYAKVLQANTGWPVVVETRPGAAGRIGFAHVAKAAPDGYTLLMVTSSFPLAPALFKSLQYDPIKDFEPITLMSKRKTIFLARASFPANNVVEYIAYAKANPGKVNFATAGLGNITHLSGAWMHSATNTKATFVHYKGVAMYPDMLTDRVDVTMDAMNGAGIPLVKAGKLKALGISSLTRSDQMPNVPTMAEQLKIPDFEYPSWLGVAAPAGTPRAIIDKLNAEFVKVSKSPEVTRKIADDGGEVIGNSPAEFKKQVMAEINRWPKIVKELGFELQD